MTMTTQVQTKAIVTTDSGVAAIFLAMLAGVFLLTVSGFAQATVLHDTAHDQRHAMAFPCH